MSAFVIFALLAVIISIVRSVMKPDLGELSGKRKPLPRGAAGTQRPLPDIQRPAPEVQRPATAAQRAATPQRAGARTAAASNNDPSRATRDALAGDASTEALRRMIEARETADKRSAVARSSAARDAARREASAQAEGSDWYIVLDVPRDAPRAEILSAVKLRIERARHAGDSQAIPRILRAAESGMGSMGAKGLRELARKLGARD